MDATGKFAEVSDRRGVLQALGLGAAGFVGLSGARRVSAHEDEDDDSGGDGEVSGGTVVIEDQTVDGDSIVVATVESPTDGVLMVQESADRDETTYARQDVPEGSHQDLTVDLDETLNEPQTLEVWLFDGSPFEDESEVLAIDQAFVSVGGETDTDLLGVTFVEADSDFGFHYPYFLFTPPPNTDETVPILVEPNNTGQVADELAVHRPRAENVVERGGIARRVSENLAVPLLVPVFPRPERDPVDWTHYVHALDRETLEISEGPLERVDRQLLRMTDHARGVLADTGHSLSDQIMLNGFSASGNFVDRFAVLHPERVLSVTAGGLNGMALLPLEEADGHTLPFHVGIADVEELTGDPVDLDALDEVDQYLYMGAEDENDTIPYDDAWTDDDLRQTALAVYGEDMVDDRFPRCEAAYAEAGVEATFHVYEGAGHSPRDARDDVLEVHRRSLENATLEESPAPNVALEGGQEPSGREEPAGDDSTSGTETGATSTAPAEDGTLPVSPRDFLLGAGVGTVVGAAVTSVGSAYWFIRRGGPGNGNEAK